MKVCKLYWTTDLFYTIFFSLYRSEVFLKPHVEACFRELKVAAASEEFATHELFVFFRLIYRGYLENKRPSRKITLVSDNKISEIWTFLFWNLTKWDKRNIDQPKFTTDHSILSTDDHSDRLLSNFKRFILIFVWLFNIIRICRLI